MATECRIAGSAPGLAGWSLADGDYDLDGVSNLAEYLAGTNPTDGPPTVVVPIAKGVDDAEESAGGVMNLTSTDLELVRDDATGAGDQIVGLRFHVPVPPSAIITSAHPVRRQRDEQRADTPLHQRGSLPTMPRFDSNKLSGGSSSAPACCGSRPMADGGRIRRPPAHAGSDAPRAGDRFASRLGEGQRHGFSLHGHRPSHGRFLRAGRRQPRRGSRSLTRCPRHCSPTS